MSISAFVKLFDRPDITMEEQMQVVANCDKTGDPELDGHINKFRISDPDGKIEAMSMIDHFLDTWWESSVRQADDFPMWSPEDRP